jgi:3-methyladenine DNA glycosylase AlkD
MAHHFITQSLLKSFESHANAEYALQMQAYMKDNFSFYGINAQPRRALQSPYYSVFKELNKEEAQSVIDELWAQPKRECHMAVLDLAGLIVKKTDVTWLSFWENKILSNSWWDTVDCIAPNFIGPLLINDTALQIKYAYKWMESDNLWLQRTSIVFQLKYKSKTNTELLSEMVLARADSKEFFIKKAGGWALREYGKTNPLWVSEFINMYQDVLSKLTVKEGSRRLFL